MPRGKYENVCQWKVSRYVVLTKLHLIMFFWFLFFYYGAIFTLLSKVIRVCITTLNDKFKKPLATF